jgi:hypothetical protein
MVGQHVLGLRDCLTQQPARPQRQPTALFGTAVHRGTHLGHDERMRELGLA